MGVTLLSPTNMRTIFTLLILGLALQFSEQAPKSKYYSNSGSDSGFDYYSGSYYSGSGSGFDYYSGSDYSGFDYYSGSGFDYYSGSDSGFDYYSGSGFDYYSGSGFDYYSGSG